MKTTEPTMTQPEAENAVELNPVAYPVPAVARARTLATRPEATAWFVAHLVAVAAITALGAVLALATITVAIVLAPVTVALFAAALLRHDRLVNARLSVS
jgi:hypothetical protein